MQRKLGKIVLIAAALTLIPWAPCHAYSQERGAGVAGGGRVARGSAHAPNPGDSRVKPRSSIDDEATNGISGSRSRDIESLEQQCLDEVNRVRRRSRLAPLEFNEGLLPVARDYSRRMAEEHFFSHTDPDGFTVRERVDSADIRWRMVGENLAYSNGYVNPVAASLHGWMESPGHRKNILDPDFSLTAVGVWVGSDGTVYFTEIFIKP